tara:strand:+ start:1940 stop:2920 length:981 start_codon:yes stop_codon:yes gene_type:complete
MDKRYQVFVSSTYADLKNERQKVLQTLMEMDCIPSGMELFPATDQEQWEFIQTVINDCDYYLLIIGGRYGTTTDEGISYTEKEYDYAVEKGIKVIAFLHEQPDELSRAKADLDPKLIKKLETFKTKVKTGRLVKFWNDTNEIPGLVALSLITTIKRFPAVGWVRANTISSNESLSELNELRKENESLRKQVESTKKPTIFIKDNLSGLDVKTKIKIKYYDGYANLTSANIELTWGVIFSSFAPLLLEQPTSTEVKSRIEQSCKNWIRDGISHSLDADSFDKLKVQMLGLGLIDIKSQNNNSKSTSLRWNITDKGKAIMMELMTEKE